MDHITVHVLLDYAILIMIEKSINATFDSILIPQCLSSSSSSHNAYNLLSSSSVTSIFALEPHDEL